MVSFGTLSAIRLFPRLGKLFLESSTVGKQGELSENCFQNLRNDLMADSVLSPSIFWGSRFFSRRLRRGLRAINLEPQKIGGLSI